MATPPLPNASGTSRYRRLLGPTRLALLIALFVAFAACLIFVWMTRDSMQALPFLQAKNQINNLADGQKTLVDLHPWQTAQALAALAVTTEEMDYAREAQRLADHEVDQAFATALRQASAQPRALTGQALALSRHVAQLQELVKEDQARVDALTRAASSAPNRTQPDGGVDELEIAKAQLGLDSDQLNDAQQDLARASGDERAQIQQELSAHEAAMRQYDAQAHDGRQSAVLSAQHYATLAGRIRAWISERSRQKLLLQAVQQSRADEAALTAEHQALEDAAERTSVTPANPAPQAAATDASTPHTETAARIASIKARSAERQLLSIFDDRIQTQRQLATVYEKWAAQVKLQHRITLHLVLQSLAFIALVLIFVMLCNTLVRHLLSRPNFDRRRVQTLSTIIQLAVQLVGILVVLLIVFGAPNQTPTILGLTTAGLTLILQDFILSFFGWFILMGKNGIRVGDSVEINGVAGEVMEIGLFRTILLETGNWTDTGHPTGRRIAFTNRFAISGQYFNFTTTGQWMWDEISVNLPASADTYAAIDQIHKAVSKETKKDVQFAEQEWKRSTKHLGMSDGSAAPAVNLRPAPSGVNIVVRYVTRASSRLEMRNRLYQCVINVLHKPEAQLAATTR